MEERPSVFKTELSEVLWKFECGGGIDQRRADGLGGANRTSSYSGDDARGSRSIGGPQRQTYVVGGSMGLLAEIVQFSFWG